MSVLSWGKPIVEIAPYVNGALPATPAWVALPVIKENTALLTTTKGAKQEGKGEGGELVDVKFAKNSYEFVCELFVKKGDTKPISDSDGVVIENYAVRLTPEDPTTEGFLLEKATVTVEETWSSADGKLWKYTFSALKPATGGMCKPYIAPEGT